MQRLGQHFLIDEGVLQKIAEAINSQSEVLRRAQDKNKIIIEIGAGHGELTKKLEERREKREEREKQQPRIIAIEKDAVLSEELKAKFRDSVEIVTGDALHVLPELTKSLKLKAKSFVICGNIPYYITGHLLRVISELAVKPARCVFLIQKEVAERIAENPPRMNRLAASVQFWAKPEILFTVPKESFEPQPKVESAVIELEVRRGEREEREMQKYYAAVRALFQQPRKTILNNLRGERREKKEERKAQQAQLIEKIKKLGIDPEGRPQTLSVEQIKKIASLLS